MKAPDFAGVGSFVRFSSDLDTFYAIHNFNDDLKLRFLPLCLSGVARDAFEALPAGSRSTYKQAIEGMSKSFGTPNALDAHAKLRNLQYDSSVSLDAFVIHFKHLMNQAFLGQLSDQMLFHAFLPTLPSRYQEHIIAQGISGFEEAVRRVQNLIHSERFQKPVRQVSAPDPDRLEQLLQRVEAIEHRLSSAERSRSGGAGGAAAGAAPVARRGGAGGGVAAGARRGGAGGVTADAASGGRRGSGAPARSCYCCGSTGHYRAACPVRDSYCTRCGRRGHTVDVCWHRGNE